jgi:cyclopropane fatty-acyl-phospholipid synthase-like methyltransferase
MRESGEALVPTLGIKAGLKVLDLGCGDGTTVCLRQGSGQKFGAWILRAILSLLQASVPERKGSQILVSK